MLNQVIPKDFLNSRQKYVDLIKSFPNPQHEQKEDAILKWVAILEGIDTLKEQGFEFNYIIDVGCGGSHLGLVLAEVYKSEVVLIDNRKHPDVCKDHPKIQLENKSFFDFWSRRKFDLVIDSCASIHFNPIEKDGYKNYGCHQFGEVCKKIMKKNSVFLTATEFSDDDGSSEFISINDLQQSFNPLKLIGELPKGIENPFNYSYRKLELKVVRLGFQK